MTRTMTQVNYTGSKKRETYDEIVDFLQTDKTKIKYPNRVAVQILNSPSMKQLDTDTLMDVQNWQDRQSKEKIKQMVLQEIAKDGDTPFVQMRAQVDRERQHRALSSVEALSAYSDAQEDRRQDFREQTGDAIEAATQTDLEKRHLFASMVAQQLEAQTMTDPIQHMTADMEVQAVADTRNKATQTPGRKQEEDEEYARRHAELERQMQEMLRRERMVSSQHSQISEKLKHLEGIRQKEGRYRSSVMKLQNDIGRMVGGGQLSQKDAYGAMQKLNTELSRLERIQKEGAIKAGMHAQPASSSSGWTFGTISGLANQFNIFTPREPAGSAKKRVKSESPQRPVSEKSFSIGTASGHPLTVKSESSVKRSVKS